MRHSDGKIRFVRAVIHEAGTFGLAIEMFSMKILTRSPVGISNSTGRIFFTQSASPSSII